MPSCQEVITELANYLDDQVTVELHARIEAHVAGCRTCEALYDSVRKTLKITTESGTFELPEATSSRLVARIMDKVRRSDPTS